MSEVHDVTPVPEPYVAPATSRRPRWIATAAVSALAVAAGAFGVMALSAGDGAESPEAAVRDLFEAIDHEDVIGVLEALDPAERDILRPAIEDTGEQAKRVEVASSDLDLRKVQGVDLQVEDLRLDVTELGDGFSAVDITGGSVSTEADLDRMPFGATIKEILDRDEREAGEDLDRSARDRIDLDGIRLVATESGGGWHVSALYSIAEQVRRSADPEPPVPDFGNGIGAKGAASPEAAVREALDAAVHLDVRRLIELTPPGEMAVLHDYGPALVEAATEATESDFEPPALSDLELEVADGPDGTKVVSATNFELTLAGGDTWAYDGTCTTYTYRYEDFSSYTYTDEMSDGSTSSTSGGEGQHPPDDPDGPMTDDVVGGTETETSKICEGDAESVVTMGSSLVSFGLLGEAAGGGPEVVVERHDGLWYVSPTRSLLESTVGGLRGLSPDDVRRTARFWAGDYWAGQPDEFWDACGVEAPPLDAGDDTAEAAYQDCIENLPEDYEGQGFGFGFDSDFSTGTERFETVGEAISEPAEGCYDLEATAETESCLQDLVDAGTIPPDQLTEFACTAPFDALPFDASEEEWAAADEAVIACLDAARGSSTEPADGGSEPDTPSETTIVSGDPTPQTAPAPVTPRSSGSVPGAAPSTTEPSTTSTSGAG